MSTDPRSFLYRPGGLDPEAALRLTADALKGCDDGELYLQYTASESFGFDDGRLKTADFNTQAGFGLRGVSGETTAFAQANELSEAAIRRAAEISPALGHPRVYMQIDEKGFVDCGYCDKRFILKGGPADKGASQA